MLHTLHYVAYYIPCYTLLHFTLYFMLYSIHYLLYTLELYTTYYIYLHYLQSTRLFILYRLCTLLIYIYDIHIYYIHIYIYIYAICYTPCTIWYARYAMSCPTHRTHTTCFTPCHTIPHHTCISILLVLPCSAFSESWPSRC